MLSTERVNIKKDTNQIKFNNFDINAKLVWGRSDFHDVRVGPLRLVTDLLCYPAVGLGI